MSDSDASEDGSECLTSAERAQQQQQHVTDEYAAAVAAVFLNTTAKTAQVARSGHDSSVSKLATDIVHEECEAVCSNLDSNATDTVSDDLNAVTSSVLLSVEHDTCTGPQNDVQHVDSSVQLTQGTYSDLQLVSSTDEATEELQLNDCIASELNSGLDSTACSELSDCVDPIELFTSDNCGALSDVYNGSFIGDLSFINQCLAEDDDSSQLLDYPGEANHVLSDIQKVDVDNRFEGHLNECTNEIIGNHDIASSVLTGDEKSAGLIQIAAAAAAAAAADDDGDNYDDDDDDVAMDTALQQSDACFTQSLPSHSYTNADSSSVMVLVNCKQPFNGVASTLYQRSSSFPASFSVSSSQPVNQPASDGHHRVASPCLSSGHQNKSILMHLDLNANELFSLPVTKTAGDEEWLMSGSGIKDADVNVDSCNVTAVDSDSADNLLSTATRKRLLPEESSYTLCKRFRAESDCLSDGLLTAVIGNASNCECDTSVVCAVSDVSVAGSGSVVCAVSDVSLASSGSVVCAVSDVSVAGSGSVVCAVSDVSLAGSGSVVCAVSDVSVAGSGSVVCAVSDVSVAGSGSNEESNVDEFDSICCCCSNVQCVVSSLSYCTDGHACCQACLQQQVKRLLSSPSKA